MATVEEKPISLSQAVLAPLNSIFKAQLHAARSFLGMLLELGYQKQAEDKGNKAGEREPWVMSFKHAAGSVEVPALALVPIAPLGVESAQYGFELAVEEIAEHAESTVANTQKRAAERKPKQKEWYLVPEPVSLRGRLGTATGPQTKSSRASTVRLEVKVAQLKTPAALERLLTSLTESAQLTLPRPGATDR